MKGKAQTFFRRRRHQPRRPPQTAISPGMQMLMQLSVIIGRCGTMTLDWQFAPGIALIGFAVGFITGYGIRAFISYRRRKRRVAH